MNHEELDHEEKRGMIRKVHELIAEHMKNNQVHSGSIPCVFCENGKIQYVLSDYNYHARLHCQCGFKIVCDGGMIAVEAGFFVDLIDIQARNCFPK